MKKLLKKRKVKKAKKLVECEEQLFVNEEVASHKKDNDVNEALIRLRIR